MKIRPANVEIFLAELAKFESEIPDIKRVCKNWVDYQQYNSGADRQTQRDYVVRRILKFRKRLGELYDLMSDRGLREIG